MPKSRDAFRTISEVADWLETPAHVLRFWESKFTQVKPVKRAGGRRYYRPSDMELLGGIKKLLHDDGMTIKGVQKVLREQGVRHVAALSLQEADPQDPPQGDLIEDAPYAEVPLDETPGSVIHYPSRPDAGRTAEAAPEPAEAIAPDQEPDDAPTETPVMPDAEEVDPEPTAGPVMADSISKPEDQVPEAADPEPEQIAAEGQAEEPVEGLHSAEPADDFGGPEDLELPFDLFAPPVAAATEPEQTDEHAAPESVEPEMSEKPEPAQSDSIRPEPETVPLAADDVETVAKTIEAEADTPEPETRAEADDTPAPEPEEIMASEPEPEVLAPATPTRPLDLPDFDAHPAPAPMAAPASKPMGPLGYIARISALSTERQQALAAHLPALRALCESRAAPRN